MFILFSCQFAESFTSRTAFVGCYLKLSLPVFLKFFSMFPHFQPHVSYKHVSYKNDVYTDTLPFISR